LARAARDAIPESPSHLLLSKEIPVRAASFSFDIYMRALTESLIVALMMFIPVVAAERIDHELSEPESGRACSCEPHLKVYVEFTAQSFRLGAPTAEHMVRVVDGDHREQEGDRTKSDTK
jgi:hypothetical protein